MIALPRLHAVTDDRVIARGNVVAHATAMAEAAGAELAVHLRARTLEGGAALALARELCAALTPHGAWLVINGRADVARAARARAVVSGRGGLPVADIRRVAPDVLVGRSVHDASEVERAAAEGADFLMASTGFPSASHGEQSANALSAFRSPVSGLRPLIAIGGLAPDRVAEVVAAGAWGVAAIRALWDADDPAGAARDFLAALPARTTVAVTINGEARRTRSGSTLAGLLTDLALDARAVVVEHNRKIVRRDDLATVGVAEGDAIELVHFVGGG